MTVRENLHEYLESHGLWPKNRLSRQRCSKYAGLIGERTRANFTIEPVETLRSIKYNLLMDDQIVKSEASLMDIHIWLTGFDLGASWSQEQNKER